MKVLTQGQSQYKRQDGFSSDVDLGGAGLGFSRGEDEGDRLSSGKREEHWLFLSEAAE